MNDQALSATEIIPVVFDGHMGSIHRPALRRGRGITVVICSPIGYEGLWTYRPLFLWAEYLASRGFQVLRYDHRGEGDSLDLDPSADQWAHWLIGLKQAAEFARAQTGARDLVVAGLRIGATLACAAAQDVKPSGLILWDPFPTGNAWLRELRLVRSMLAAGQEGDDILEVNGVRLTAATIETLGTVDLTRMGVAWPATLLASPTASKQLLASLGPDLETVPFSGYSKLFKLAHFNEAPMQLFEATARWLDARFAAQQVAYPALTTPIAQLTTADWQELRVDFGNGLRGVLCLPKRGNASLAVIVCSTAGNPRSGDASFGARTCRALACAGLAALRFDFYGVGESADPWERKIHVYETSRTDDLRHAAALLRERGFDDIVVTGVCTGGFHAVRAVIEDTSIRRALAINSWLSWRRGAELDSVAHATSLRAAYLRIPAGGRKWLRTLEGDLRLLKRRFFPDAASRAVRAEIKRASKRGVRIHIVIGELDRSRDGLADFGQDGRWLTRQPGLSLTFLQGLDHSLYTTHSQNLAMRELFEFIGISTESLPMPSTTSDSAAPVE
jgi:dienelactone hydrolase